MESPKNVVVPPEFRMEFHVVNRKQPFAFSAGKVPVSFTAKTIKSTITKGGEAARANMGVNVTIGNDVKKYLFTPEIVLNEFVEKGKLFRIELFSIEDTMFVQGEIVIETGV